MAVYPNYNWKPTKFLDPIRAPPGYWKDPSKALMLIEKIGKDLGVKQVHHPSRCTTHPKSTKIRFQIGTRYPTLTLRIEEDGDCYANMALWKIPCVRYTRTLLGRVSDSSKDHLESVTDIGEIERILFAGCGLLKRSYT